jgi:hypothetical protein
MARFQVIRIDAEPCPAGLGRRHITDVELKGLDGLHLATVPVVRLMLSADDSIVAMSAKDRHEVDVRKSRCVCGYKTIRSVAGTRGDDDLDTFPA